MSGVSIRIEGGDATRAKLAAAVALLTDPRPLYDRIGSALILSTSQRFEKAQGPDGNPWPASIRVLTQGGKTLQNTGHLRKNITKEVSQSGVAVGTDVLYAAVHQFGATIRPVKGKALRFRIGGKWISKASVTIPARPFLGLNRADEIEIEKITGDEMAHALGGVDAR